MAQGLTLSRSLVLCPANGPPKVHTLTYEQLSVANPRRRNMLLRGATLRVTNSFNQAERPQTNHSPLTPFYVAGYAECRLIQERFCRSTKHNNMTYIGMYAVLTLRSPRVYCPVIPSIRPHATNKKHLSLAGYNVISVGWVQPLV